MYGDNLSVSAGKKSIPGANSSSKLRESLDETKSKIFSKKPSQKELKEEVY